MRGFMGVRGVDIRLSSCCGMCIGAVCGLGRFWGGGLLVGVSEVGDPGGAEDSFEAVMAVAVAVAVA